MDKTNFAVSLLNGRFQAAHFRKGAIVKTWDGPEVREDFLDLAAILREASANTGADAKHVTMVLALPRLSEQLIEVPRIKGRDLTRFLQRHVQNSKAFPGDAVWSRQTALPTAKSNAVLVHVLPKLVLDQLMRGCQEAQFQLVRLLPTTSVLMHQLKSLPLQKDEVALLAAESGSATTIVIGRKDGRVCLSRVLPNSWRTDPERVWVDLTRSIGFAEQQSGATVGSVWLFGTGADTHVQTLEQIVKVPVRLSPLPYTPAYWLEQAAKLPQTDDGDLISAEMRQAPQRRRMLTVTGFLVCLLLAVSLLAAVVLEVVRAGALKAVSLLDLEIAKLQGEQRQLKSSLAEIEDMEAVIRVVNANRLPPVPNWFLGYLGQTVPEELTLTRLDLIRTNDLWSVQLLGAARPNLDLSKTGAVQQAFTALSSNLMAGPFHVAISRSQLGDSNDRSAPNWVELTDLRTFSTAPARDPMQNPESRNFRIEGVMR